MKANSKRGSDFLEQITAGQQNYTRSEKVVSEDGG
jgi:hypothetical protein